MIELRGREPWVLEAHSGVELTPLADWIDRGMASHVVIKRLRKAEGLLTPTVVKRMKEIGKSLLGLPYNGRYLWRGKGLYCSQLVFQVFDRLGIDLGKIETFGDLMEACRDANKGKLPPAARALAVKLFGSVENVPPDQKVITPVSIMDDPALTTVFENDAPED
jgi:hypothetical protein